MQQKKSDTPKTALYTITPPKKYLSPWEAEFQINISLLDPYNNLLPQKNQKGEMSTLQLLEVQRQNQNLKSFFDNESQLGDVPAEIPSYSSFHDDQKNHEILPFSKKKGQKDDSSMKNTLRPSISSLDNEFTLFQKNEQKQKSTRRRKTKKKTEAVKQLKTKKAQGICRCKRSNCGNMDECSCYMNGRPCLENCECAGCEIINRQLQIQQNKKKRMRGRKKKQTILHQNTQKNSQNDSSEYISAKKGQKKQPESRKLFKPQDSDVNE